MGIFVDVIESIVANSAGTERGPAEAWQWLKTYVMEATNGEWQPSNPNFGRRQVVFLPRKERSEPKMMQVVYPTSQVPEA
jgi:hypothetical protein